MSTPKRSRAFDPARHAIEAAMKRRRISAQDLERIAGLTTGHLSKILSGQIQSVDSVTMCLIAEALEIEIGKLLPRDEICEAYRAELRLPVSKIRRA